MSHTQPDRCPWPGIQDPLYAAYHDQEWGVPALDDQRLFEMLILESQQAGLSWLTILKRRNAYRQALNGFDPNYVASLKPADITLLAQKYGLLRHTGKLLSLNSNAKAFLKLADQYGSFSHFLWNRFDYTSITRSWSTLAAIPVQTEESADLARTLKKAGFCYVGPIMVHAYLQAIGVYNDHLVSCSRYLSLSAGSSQSLSFKKNSTNSRSGS